MKLLRLVPTASLAVAGGVLAFAVLTDPPLNFPFSEPPGGPPMPEVELTVGPLDLVGRVVDALGMPVDGAGVSTKSAGRPYWTWTDANGGFALRELEGGEKRVLVAALGFYATGFDVELSAGTADPVELVLERRIGELPDPPGLELGGLVGTVAFGPLATPTDGYELLLLPATRPADLEGGFPRRVHVEADGTFEVPYLHAGEYRVVLLAPADRGANGPDLLTDADGAEHTLVHRLDDETTALRLESTAGAVRGLVLGPGPWPGDGETSSTRAVRGALVRIERLVDERDATDSRERTADVLRDEFRAIRTDETGRYAFGDLAPGRYRVTVVAGRSRRQSEVTVPRREIVDVDFETAR